MNIGDRVSLKDDTPFRFGGLVATIEDIDGYDVKLKESKTWCNSGSLKVVERAADHKLKEELEELKVRYMELEKKLEEERKKHNEELLRKNYEHEERRKELEVLKWKLSATKESMKVLLGAV
jgi:predicted RNase H-like nuclease (RuvC/YqgF family)